MSSRENPIEWLDLERYSDTPMFNTKAVVQQTGVPAPTLRAWERRYTLITPERGDNAYRLYSERDIALIRWLKGRIDAGMSISQAIALFRHMSEEHAESAPELNERTEESERSQKDQTHPHVTKMVIPPSDLTEQEELLQPLKQWEQLQPDSTMHMGYPIMHNMQMARERLIETFRNFDEPMAHMIMGSLLAIYPVEQVCIEFIAPTLWRVGQLWSEKHLTVPEEHFATNFFRALLINLFHVMPGPLSGPHALICCSPGEPHELGALMLALFLRRRGIRVAYMGQSIETTGLISTIHKLIPSLVCLSLTMPTYLPALISLSRQIQAMPPPRPIFAFGGQVFSQSQYTNMIAQIPGVYMHGDLRENADTLRALILDHLENKN